MSMSSNPLLTVDKRADLLSEYERFLEQAEANREHVIKYSSLLFPEQYNNLIQKVEADIDFANRKILELSIPSISNIVQAPGIPSLPPEIPAATEIKTQDADSSLAWLGVAVAGLVAVPFILKAAADNPGATRQFIHQLAILFHSDEV